MEVIDKNALGKRIKDIRVIRRETLEEFADAIREKTNEKVKTTKSNVSKWEKGLNVPNDVTLKAIADLAEMSVNQLLYGEPKYYLRSLLWNSKSVDDFSDITFDNFFDDLKESVSTEDDLYLSEDEAVKRYKRFAEINKLDEHVDPLGYSIYSALENKEDPNVVQMYLTDADTNFSLLFGKSLKDAYDDYTNELNNKK